MGIVLFIAYELDGVDDNNYLELEQAQCSFDTMDDSLNNTIIFDIFNDSCPSHGAFIHLPQGNKFAGQQLNRASCSIKASFSTKRSNVKVKEWGFRNLISDTDSAKFARDLVQSAKPFQVNYCTCLCQLFSFYYLVYKNLSFYLFGLPMPGFTGTQSSSGECRFQRLGATSLRNSSCIRVRPTQTKTFVNQKKRQRKYKSNIDLHLKIIL